MSPTSKIAAVILAAGNSRRMGERNKLLLPFEGVPLIRRVAKRVTDCSFSKTILVTGHEREKIENAASDLQVDFVFNPEYENGMGSSLARAVKHLSPESLDGILITLGDLKDLETATILKVARAFSDYHGTKIIIPTFQGERGHPVIFPRRFIEQLSKVQGDTGAKNLIKGNGEHAVFIECDTPSILRDIDTPKDLEA
ncbi:MAG: nucleotidyltransferase family protein [Verrucomicrobiota bacterium]